MALTVNYMEISEFIRCKYVSENFQFWRSFLGGTLEHSSIGSRLSWGAGDASGRSFQDNFIPQPSPASPHIYNRLVSGLGREERVVIFHDVSATLAA